MRRLLLAMGSVKVWELACLADMRIEQVIEMVVHASGLPAIPLDRPSGQRAARRAHNGPGGNRSVITPIEPFSPPRRPPMLARMVGRATLREVDALVERWALATVLDANAWNVTRTAKQLGMSRHDLRDRWTKLRSMPREVLNPGARRATNILPPMPEPPSLPGLLEGGATLTDVRDAARGWFVTCTATLNGGNRTQTAATLDVSRRRVREILAAYAVERPTTSHASTVDHAAKATEVKPAGAV